jgi:predicted ABC-type ATPase
VCCVSDPVLSLIAGPNGSGTSTFVERILSPYINLPFVNADLIAAEPSRLIAGRQSFMAETAFSHPSTLEQIEAARAAGYIVVLHVIVVAQDLAVARVRERVTLGGHGVPEAKIRSRFERLWGHAAQAIARVDDATVYDNTTATHPYRIMARYHAGYRVGPATWPDWAPRQLVSAGRWPR